MVARGCRAFPNQRAHPTLRRAGRAWMAEREAMEFDVVVGGAGPAGLAAAIRLKQLAPEAGGCRGGERGGAGAPTPPGAVIEPRALNELLPNWQSLGAPLNTPAAEDRFLYLTKSRAIR